MANEYPRRINICPWTSWSAVNEVTGSSTVRTQASTYLSGGLLNSSSASVSGYYIEYKVPISTGTWTLTMIGRLGTAQGIFKVSIDGVDVVTGIDRYSGSSTDNSVVEATGIVITSSGVKTVRFTVTGKNASATAYAFQMHWFSFRRTA